MNFVLLPFGVCAGVLDEHLEVQVPVYIRQTRTKAVKRYFQVA